MEAKTLIHTLFIELFQTERSANLHSMREAERYGDAPPAIALRAVAHHAASIMPDLRELAAARKIPETESGVAIGSLFSKIRDQIADRLINSERSYRGTLLGMRHGIDVVRSLRHAALAAEDFTLSMFCDGWLAARTPLVEEVAAKLEWFGKNPERALATAKPMPWSRSTSRSGPAPQAARAHG